MGSASEPQNPRLAHCTVPAKKGDPPRTYGFMLYKTEAGQEMICEVEKEECVTEACSSNIAFYQVADTGFIKTSFRLPEKEQDLFLRSGYYFDRVRKPTGYQGYRYALLNDSTVTIEHNELRMIRFAEGNRPAEYAEFSSSIVYHFRQYRWIPDPPKSSMMPEAVWKKLNGGFDAIGRVVDSRGYVEVMGEPDETSAVRGVVYANIEICFDIPENPEEKWVKIVSRTGLNGYIKRAKIDYGH